MSELKSRIQQDLTTAMKARQARQVAALRLIIADIKKQEIDQQVNAEDNWVIQLLVKSAKQRRESITQYQQANRDDLVEQEQFELEIIENYLPQPLSEAEVDTLIQQALAQTGASSMKDMGAVIAILKPKIQGRADMGKISSKIKQALA
ncbi:MAG: GatB/YqeY domain-containing protein [Legionellales bacterium]|nr:GatB/YqeY domain-containing protein [Legionellales bacterium]